MIFYQSEEFIIRDIIESDVVSLFTCWIDKEINLHDPRPLPNTSKELFDECSNFCKNFDTQIMNEDETKRIYKYFIITDPKGYFIGFINLFSIDKKTKDGELGIILGDKRYWKKGIATKAMEIVVDYIFANMDLDIVHIETASTNIPALRLAEKCGFEKYDEFVDDGMIGISMRRKKKND